ncbi:MAG: biotin-dependent carboxyltransferase family protein [Hyphomicrobiaceae bacterium]|nr:biotin-dependent carboxyltransferase family protein [Hyphomicrobiaceae bacterium]
MTGVLRVVQPGLVTTVQDLGRTGYQRLGIPVSGALDPIALRAANIVVGNPETTAGLEMAVLGPTLEVEASSVRLALAGQGTELVVERSKGDALRVPALQSVRLSRGDRVRVSVSGGSAAAYLAVEAGFDLRHFLDSLSTYVRGGFGGLDGRALQAGDALPLVRDGADARQEVRLPGLDLGPATQVRVVLGPQDDYFTAGAIATFLAGTYTVTRDADRMGLRLEGPGLAHAKGYNIVSDGIAPGSIQVPGTCQPIVLLADRQTTGGYPKIATVISADLAAVGRLVPGLGVRFEAVSVEAAQAARRALEADMKALAGRLSPVAPEGPDLDRLYDSNLVGGVVSALAHPTEWVWLDDP